MDKKLQSKFLHLQCLQFFFSIISFALLVILHLALVMRRYYIVFVAS
jgi:hypothetical protein